MPEFQITRNSLEKNLFPLLPVIVIAISSTRVLLSLSYSNQYPSITNDTTWMIVNIWAVLFFILSNSLFLSIAEHISSLYLSKSISTQKIAGSPTKKQMIYKIDNLLNHSGRILLGINASVLVLAYYLPRLPDIYQFIATKHQLAAYIDIVLFIVPNIIYAYFIGITTWKALITVWALYNIPRRFHLQMQLEHPDGAAGFLPVGLLSLKIFYQFSLPTILFGFILVTPYLIGNIRVDILLPNYVMLKIFAPIMLLCSIFLSIISLTPIFRFHQIMKKDKQKKLLIKEKISSKITVLRKNMLNQIVYSKKANQKLQKMDDINFLEALYQHYTLQSNWPLNNQIALKITSTLAMLAGQLLALWNIIQK